MQRRYSEVLVFFSRCFLIRVAALAAAHLFSSSSVEWMLRPRGNVVLQMTASVRQGSDAAHGATEQCSCLGMHQSCDAVRISLELAHTRYAEMRILTENECCHRFRSSSKTARFFGNRFSYTFISCLV